MSTSFAPSPDEQVLPTLSKEGKRIWIQPKLAKGRYYTRRLIFAWALIVVFTAIPWIKANGKPLILLDLPQRHFTFFGTTFFATDTVLLMLLVVGLLVGVFLLTALFGRVWCGWACPQTIYMEFVYRPLERLLEGSGRRKGGEISPGRRVLKYVVYLFVSAFLAHTFLSYFVGVDQLRVWITGSPSDHPAAFFVMLATTALMMFDFAVFREQTCLVACPYGRFQSVLLDRNSLIVGYDAKRGEPRGRAGDRKRAGESAVFGDCIECGACVHTCPTGIDIRKGLQMECVHCTQCIDACDAIMVKIGKPKGLIRYSSQDELSGAPKRFLRPRTVAYPLLMALILGLFTIALASKQDTDVTILRGLGAPYTEIGPGQVSNQIRIKIVNRADEDRSYSIELHQADEATLIAPQNPLPVPAGKSAETSVFVTSPSTYFTQGRHEVVFRIKDGKSFIEDEPYHLLGPQS